MTVTVAESFLLLPLLDERGASQNNSSIFPVSVGRLERKCFQLTRKGILVDRSSFSCVGSVFHARGAETAKVLSPIRRRRVGGTTRSPDDEARSTDRVGTPATDVSKSEMYAGDVHACSES